MLVLGSVTGDVFKLSIISSERNIDSEYIVAGLDVLKDILWHAGL
jgi:hypothetical protein